MSFLPAFKIGVWNAWILMIWLLIPFFLEPLKIIPKGREEGNNFIEEFTKIQKNEWQLIQQRLGSLNFTSRDYRYFSRLLHSVAVNINLDRQGRLLIPSHLQKDAGLTKEILVIGVYRWIELWNPDSYRDYLSQYGQSYEEVAEKLFDLNRGQED